MFEKYFGFQEQPFSETPDPDFLYLSRGHREALAFLEYQILDGKGFSVLVGEVGTGKTTLCKALNRRLHPERTTLIHFSFSHLDLEEFLVEVLEGLDVSPASTGKGDLLKVLKGCLQARQAQGRRVVLLFDEAQELRSPVLEGLRMVSNLEMGKEKMLHLVFVGQPSFLERLNQADLRQLQQRVSGTFHLGPLSRPETHEYIESRLNKVQKEPRVRFTPEAKDLIWRLSRGIPRVINFLCRDSLAQAFVADAFIIPETFVQKAYSRRQGLADGSIPPGPGEERPFRPLPSHFPHFLSVPTPVRSVEAPTQAFARPRPKGPIMGWAVAAVLILVIAFDLFFLFYRQEEGPVPLSETYRHEIVFPRGEKGGEHPRIGQVKGGWSMTEPFQRVAFQNPSPEDPGQ